MDYLVHKWARSRSLFPAGAGAEHQHIPPIHVGSKAFLKMMFGPGAEQAVATYKNAMEGNDPSCWRPHTNVSTDQFNVRDGEVAGFGENGQNSYVPLKEPIVRPAFDESLAVYRYNVT